MFVFAARVLEDATNQPTAAQAYELSGSAVTGFRTFASQLADGDEVHYLAEEVDGNGNPAGAWELGEGVYVAATDDIGSRVLTESSSGALIDWSVVGATPRVSIVDRSLGMCREIARWDHAVDGDSATIDFVFTARPQATYMLDIYGIRFGGSTNGLIFLRCRRAGSWDAGLTDYLNQQWSRRATSTYQAATVDSAFHVTPRDVYARAFGTDDTNGFQAQVWVKGMGDAVWTHFLDHFNAEYTNQQLSLTGGVQHGEHRYTEVVEGLRLISETGANWEVGTVRLLEFL